MRRGRARCTECQDWFTPEPLALTYSICDLDPPKARRTDLCDRCRQRWRERPDPPPLRWLPGG